MHPDLRLSNLGRLPLHLRRIAYEACATSRSPQDIQHLADTILSVPECRVPHLLPAAYILLDPEYIPNVEELGTLHFSQGAFLQHVAVLRAVLTTRIPRHLAPELWPRVWKWVRFVHTHREHFAGLPVETQLCFEFLQFVCHLHDRPRAAAFMYSEPGVCFMIARTWQLIFNSPERDEGQLRRMSYLLVGFIPVSATALEEILDAVGGLDHFAILLVGNLSWVLETRETPLSERDIYFMNGILNFQAVTSMERAAGNESTVSELCPSQLSLRHHGIIPLLATAAVALVESGGGHTSDILKHYFATLTVLLQDGWGHGWLPAAVNNGLLRAIVLWTTKNPEESQLSIKCILSFMSSYLVYYPIPSAMDAALRALDDLISSEGFQASPMYDKWEQFTDLVQQRYALVQMFDSGAYTNLKACDNLECSTIAEKTVFKRCSGCQKFYYCSQECQIQDWRVGGHRDNCSVSDAILSEPHRLSVRERGFLRALVHQDYLANKSHIWGQQALALGRHPSEDIFTIFDYATGSVKIAVVSVSEVAHFLPSGQGWKSSVWRAQRSNGKYCLHVVSLFARMPLCPLLLPLRRSRGSIHRVLKETVSEVFQTGFRTPEKFLERADAILQMGVTTPEQFIERFLHDTEATPVERFLEAFFARFEPLLKIEEEGLSETHQGEAFIVLGRN
ncbi:hypothetical protein C8R43DRAFT_1144388 [Mycena crocata]|nr:hypothetical protein C8R43DRAFT_1144388 [Mycena crocata]